MKKLIVFLMALGLIIGGSGLAKADLIWQTTPILGTETHTQTNPSLGCNDVIVVTSAGLVNIPHDGIINDPRSMTWFYVGQTVDAGSGIYYGIEGNTYKWTVDYTGPTRTVSYFDNYPGNSGEGFVMNYLDPVSTLTLEDVGVWTYTETWTNQTNGSEGPLSYSTNFTVGVPEPGTLILLGSGLLGLVAVGRKKFRE